MRSRRLRHVLWAHDREGLAARCSNPVHRKPLQCPSAPVCACLRCAQPCERVRAAFCPATVWAAAVNLMKSPYKTVGSYNRIYFINHCLSASLYAPSAATPASTATPATSAPRSTPPRCARHHLAHRVARHRLAHRAARPSRTYLTDGHQKRGIDDLRRS
jgi:hypothetical protein